MSGPATGIALGVRGTATLPSPTATVRVVTVIVNRVVNMRSEPNIRAAIVAVLFPGTAVMASDTEAIGSNDSTQWVRVAYDGEVGYIRADLLGTIDTALGRGK